MVLFISSREYVVFVGDVAIPAGTTVIINVLGLHKNQTYFPDPEIFNPEHFSVENCKKLHKGCYLPFSAGPRNCISSCRLNFENFGNLLLLLGQENKKYTRIK